MVATPRGYRILKRKCTKFQLAKPIHVKDNEKQEFVFRSLSPCNFSRKYFCITDVKRSLLTGHLYTITMPSSNVASFMYLKV